MPKLLKKGVKRSRLMCGDCRKLLKQFKPNTFSSVVTDPPYELGFMGKKWDSSGVAFQPETWRSVLRVCKPGAFLLAFGGTRTYHRLVCAIEDAGWEIRDCLAWVYGSGFPKSLDISKAIDKVAGAEREKVAEGKPVKRMIPGADQNKTGSWIKDNGRVFIPTETAPATPLAQRWNGWGTALKPAHEPIVLAMKPLDGTFAANAEKYGVAGLNVDGCRIDSEVIRTTQGQSASQQAGTMYSGKDQRSKRPFENTSGRWPANLIHDGSDEVLEVFPETTASTGRPRNNSDFKSVAKGYETAHTTYGHDDNGGSAARFFYCAKASKKERTCNGKVENKHPTVKPLSLMKYLVKLVSYPKLNYILDPFCGSGSTLIACKGLGIKYVGIDLDDEAVLTAIRRLKYMGVG